MTVPATGPDYVWRWRRQLPDRFGQRCRVVESERDEVVVEFADGARHRARRVAVRRCR